MARQRTSTFEDVIIIASKLPWWVGFTLAITSYLVLHFYATRPLAPPSAPGPGQFGSAAVHSMFTTLAMIGQFLLPFAFSVGALVSAVGSFRQKKLLEETAKSPDVAALNSMTWQEFEMLVAEYYRQKGFAVSREGGNGPDGGIDLCLRKGNDHYLVQCKQWRAFKVGVQPVRELYGVMAARGSAGGYFVTSGEYTSDAVEFAKGRNLDLINGVRLKQMIDEVHGKVQSPIQESELPICPKCGGALVKRVASKGKNIGKEFWGCSNYPRCRHTSE